MRLGFLADFLSRSVLIGFLTGVGIQVAMGQVAGMFGVPGGSDGGPIQEFIETLSQIPSQASWTTAAVSASVFIVILGLKAISPKIPGALIAVVGAIAVSWIWDLQAHGVAVLGKVPSGLPSFGIPDYGWDDLSTIIATAASIFLVVLAQSAATSRAYAAKYADRFDENLDLVGLSFANVVGGSLRHVRRERQPHEDPDGRRRRRSEPARAAHDRGDRADRAAVPHGAAAVHARGGPLVDRVPDRGGAGRHPAACRRSVGGALDEFVVAAITALVVVTIGVEQGILLAIVLSLLDHIRRSYHPRDTLLVKEDSGRWRTVPVPAPEEESPATDAEPGLVIYRFGATLYYANANRFTEEIRSLLDRPGGAPAWVCIDCAAIGDVDFSGGETLHRPARRDEGEGIPSRARRARRRGSGRARSVRTSPMRSAPTRSSTRSRPRSWPSAPEIDPRPRRPAAPPEG